MGRSDTLPHPPLPDADVILRLAGVDAAPAGDADPVLRGISLEVRRGECIALVGPSGAGKTTLLRTIGAVLPARSGSITFGTQEIASLQGDALRALRRHIGMVTQKHDLIEGLRVEKNVMAGALGRWSNWQALRFLALSGRSERAEAEAALRAVGLSGMGRRLTSELSGGEQQRVAIARALVQSPELMLADEPVAALDPANAEEILDLLTGLARSYGMALICSLHQPDLAARYCDRRFELRGGTLVELG